MPCATRRRGSSPHRFPRRRATAAAPDVPLFAQVVPHLINPRGVIQALLDGRIDVGPLDSYSHDLIRHTEPDVARDIRILTSTAPTAMPPFVCTDVRVSDDQLERLRSVFARVTQDVDDPQEPCIDRSNT